MIIDSIKNMALYSQIPEEVIRFLNDLNKDTPSGHYVLNDRIFVNVDEYNTKLYKDCYFEAHKKYIDIQLLLDGNESLEYRASEGLPIKDSYNETKDIMFFDHSNDSFDVVNLEVGKFAYILPEEAHKPQISINDNPKAVKKVVVKILA